MYGQNQGIISSGTEQPVSPELVNVNDRIQKQNLEQTSLIYEIEEKLHTVFDMRSPEKPVSQTGESRSHDFVTTIHDQLSVMSNSNYRLTKILDHIKRIIG